MNTDQSVTSQEIAALRDLHKNISLPRAGTIEKVDVCVACGYPTPCPTIRLCDTVVKLREVYSRYSESLHEDDSLRVHGGKRVC